MPYLPKVKWPADLELQIDPEAAAGLDKGVAAGFASDRSGMAMVWLRRWSLHYLSWVPDLDCVSEGSVKVSVTASPSLLEILQHYPGCSPAAIASAVVNAEGLHVMDWKRRDQLIMGGHFDFDQLDR